MCPSFGDDDDDDDERGKMTMGLGQKHDLYSRAEKRNINLCVVVKKDKLLLCKLIKLNQLSKKYRSKSKQIIPKLAGHHYTHTTHRQSVNLLFYKYDAKHKLS